MFFGIGNYFDTAGWAHLGKDTANALSGTGHAAKTLAHGVAGGITAELGGGNFGNGFISAGVTQAFAPGIDNIDGGNAGFSVLRTVSAAAVGGTASALSGGKFANGAVTAAFSRAFNDEVTAQTITVELWYEPAWSDFEHTVVIVDPEGSPWYMRGGPSDRAGGDITSGEGRGQVLFRGPRIRHRRIHNSASYPSHVAPPPLMAQRST